MYNVDLTRHLVYYVYIIRSNLTTCKIATLKSYISQFSLVKKIFEFVVKWWADSLTIMKRVKYVNNMCTRYVKLIIIEAEPTNRRGLLLEKRL